MTSWLVLLFVSDSAHGTDRLGHVPHRPFLRRHRAHVLITTNMPSNLKQRLAALSLASSSPTSPLGVANIRNPLQRPWKRASAGEPDAGDRVHEVMAKVIFQAGVDYEYISCLISPILFSDPRKLAGQDQCEPKIARSSL